MLRSSSARVLLLMRRPASALLLVGKRRAAVSVLASQQDVLNNNNNNNKNMNDDAQQQHRLRWAMAATASAAAAAAAVWTTTTTKTSTTHCEQQQQQQQQQVVVVENTPSVVGREDLQDVTSEEKNLDDLPEYTSEEVAVNNGDDGRPIWMTYGGIVYDVTSFIPNHPGGDEKILMASGSAIEPYWHLYRQHYASDLPMRLMEHMIVGRLRAEDQEAIDDQMSELQDTSEDPYALEPTRHKSLLIHSDTPMNAETPAALLTENYLTPPALFYIRHHHPVPYLSQDDVKNFALTLDLSACGKGRMKFSLEELKEMDKVEVTATLQCSGNRRGGFNAVQRTSGTSWGQGAVSTARWGGVRLSDLLKKAGLDDAVRAQEEEGMEHVRFHAIDGMSASIGIEKAMNPYGDVIVCYEMNGEPLPRDHGFPLRVIVPGYAAVRNVKWVNKIELAKTEAEGAWQRGLNYKTLPPSVTDAGKVQLDRMPSMTEASLFSGITKVERVDDVRVSPGDTIPVRASGWAWAGGGRNIVRVDVTGDSGRTWSTATITQGGNQRFGRAWAWVFWECEVPAVVQEDHSVHLASKSVDLAFNVQPERCDHTWNVRGLGNNSWHRVSKKI